jgi:hypothetical protein
MPVVELKGNIDLRKAMRRFTPDLEKELRKELRLALSPVVKQARSFVPPASPMSNWNPRQMSESAFPYYSAGTIRDGISYSTSASKIGKTGFTSQARIVNQSRVGAIFETAGSVPPGEGQPWVGPKGPKGKRYSHSNNERAGYFFIKALPPLTKAKVGTGRLIYRAWELNQGRAMGAALKAIDNAKYKFESYTVFNRGIKSISKKAA